MRRRHVISWMAVLALGPSLGFRAAPPTYALLDASGDPLKAAFNNDVGKVRVIMLVAPT